MLYSVELRGQKSWFDSSEYNDSSNHALQIYLIYFDEGETMIVKLYLFEKIIEDRRNM